jgi:hypothetical protein
MMPGIGRCHVKSAARNQAAVTDQCVRINSALVGGHLHICHTLPGLYWKTEIAQYIFAYIGVDQPERQYNLQVCFLG